jgi:hypothetical protein
MKNIPVTLSKKMDPIKSKVIPEITVGECGREAFLLGTEKLFHVVSTRMLSTFWVISRRTPSNLFGNLKNTELFAK